MSSAASDIEEVSPVSDKVELPPNKNATQMMLVEIDSQVAMAAIPGGHVVRQGVYRYRLYQGWLPVLKRQERTAEDRAEYARCVAMHNKLLKERIDRDCATLHGLEKEQVEQYIRDTYSGSPEAIFARDNSGRSVPPFERVTVIEADLPAPQDEAALSRAKETASLAAQVVREMNAAQNQQKKS